MPAFGKATKKQDERRTGMAVSSLVVLVLTITCIKKSVSQEDNNSTIVLKKLLTLGQTFEK